MTTSTSRPSFEEVSARAERTRGPQPQVSLSATLRGFVIVLAFALCIVFVSVSILSGGGCLPAPSCPPNTASCVGDIPHICASTGRGYSVSEPPVRCAEVGGVCRVFGDIAACVPPDASSGSSVDASALEAGAR